MSTILILCAGEQSRWEREEPKQLVEVFGEPLLSRTVRQLEERGYKSLVATHRPEIIEVVGNNRCIRNLRYPSFDKSVTETATYSHIHWTSSKTILLLGDVIFPDVALDRILKDRDPISVYGRTDNNEIFALTFAHSEWKRVFTYLLLSIPGKMAQFYRTLCGFHFNTPQYENEIFKDLRGSWITDFDTVRVYEEFLKSWQT